MSEPTPKHPVRRLFALYKAWTGGPLVNAFFLCAGICIVMFLAPYLRQDLKIVAGAELVLLALVRFLLNKQTRWFFWALLFVGVCLPLAAGATAPIYYSAGDGWFSRAFFEMMAVGALVGVPLIGVSLWGIRWQKRNPGPPREEPAWFEKFEWFFEGAVWLMVFTLSQGQWSSVAVAAVATGAVFFALGSFLLLVVRLGLGRRGIANMFSITGGVSLMTSLILIASQGGRVSAEEAGAPIAIGVVFLAIGAALRLSKRTSTEVVR